MHNLKLQRFPAGTVLLLLSGLVVVGFCLASRYGDVNATPLAWLLTFAIAPLVSLGCVVAMHRQTDRPRWITALGALLALPQLLVWAVTVWWMLHYLRVLK